MKVIQRKGVDSMNQNQQYFMEALSSSWSDGKIPEGSTLVMHSYHPDGRYSTEYIKVDVGQIAAIICANDYDKLFCNSEDYAVFCTAGKRLLAGVEGLDEKFIAELMETVEKFNKE